MRRTTLAAAAALTLVLPATARAQIPVTDALANAQAQITNSQLFQQVAQADLRPLDIARMGVQTYDITHYQPILFCGEGFGEVEDVVGRFFTEVDDDLVGRLLHDASAPA